MKQRLSLSECENSPPATVPSVCLRAPTRGNGMRPGAGRGIQRKGLANLSIHALARNGVGQCAFGAEIASMSDLSPTVKRNHSPSVSDYNSVQIVARCRDGKHADPLRVGYDFRTHTASFPSAVCEIHRRDAAGAAIGSEVSPTPGNDWSDRPILSGTVWWRSKRRILLSE